MTTSRALVLSLLIAAAGACTTPRGQSSKTTNRQITRNAGRATQDSDEGALRNGPRMDAAAKEAGDAHIADPQKPEPIPTTAPAPQPR